MRYVLLTLLLCAVTGCDSDSTPRDPFSKSQPEYDAAAAGDAESQFKLGEKCYDEDSGITALKWFRKAAEQGHAQAMHSIASVYDSSLTSEGLDWKTHFGVAKNDAEAVNWYRKAALRGNFWSAKELAFKHEYGIGAESNLAEAYAWLSVAAVIASQMESADRDSVQASALKTLLRTIADRKKTMRGNQLATAQKRADELIAQIKTNTTKKTKKTKKNAAAVARQNSSGSGGVAREAVTTKASGTKQARRWYNQFIVKQGRQRVLQSGRIKPHKVVVISLKAKQKRHIGFGTNAFQGNKHFTDGESIAFHQTNGAVPGKGVTSKNGNGGGLEFTPVAGVLSFRLKNNSKHTLKYVIYELVKTK